MKKSLIIILSVSLSIIISCTPRTKVLRTFESPPEKKIHEIATLIVPTEQYSITSINGKENPHPNSVYTIVKFIPGNNTIGFDFHHKNPTYKSSLTIVTRTTTGKYVGQERFEYQHYDEWSTKKNELSFNLKTGYIYTIKSSFKYKRKKFQHWLVEVGPYRYRLNNGREIFTVPDKCMVVVKDGTKQKEYELEIYTLKFSPSLGKMDFINSTSAHNNDKHGIYGWPVIDGLELDQNATSPVIFSPDGKKWAYSIMKGFFASDMAVIENGKEGKEYIRIYSPLYKLNNTLTYILRDKNFHPYYDSKSRLIYRAQRKEDKKFVIVTDGEESQAYDEIYGAYMDKNDRLIYQAFNRVKIDGKSFIQEYRLTDGMGTKVKMYRDKD